MVEAGFAASNWLGLTPWIDSFLNFLDSRSFLDNHYLYISHVHVATLRQEQLYNLLLEVGKTRSCVEGRGLKSIRGIQPAKAYV